MAIKQELEKREKRTCLHDKHLSLGAFMSPFGGFEMPIQYAGIAPEHFAVREKVGLFDVSHMGEVVVRGKDAERYVQHIFTNDVAGAPVGKIYYGMMCYENGGTVDDLLVYKMGENDFFLVINAANIDKDWAWMQQHAEGFDIDLRNVSDDYGQLAVQGPESEHIMETVLGLPCKELTFYTVKKIQDVIVSRTGYTGEDGFEIYAAPDYIRECWDKMIATGVQPCGLGCRDTLRFEVGLPLYGDELSEVGIELFDKAIPRHGYTVLNMEGEPIGEVTTGYHTLSTDKSVCMALVDAAYSKLDTEVQIQIRKKVFPGKVVKKQFYTKNYKK